MEQAVAGPLAGVRVVELGQVLAGPFAGAILADLGAEVTKVERVEGGHDARRMGMAFRHGDALNFHIFNRGKRSVALDMRSPAGRSALEQLAGLAPESVVGGSRPANRSAGSSGAPDLGRVRLSANGALLRAAVFLAEAFGRVRPGNRSPEYLGPYMMAAGCNVGITAELYLAAGGFPRTRIEDVHEDRALVNAVRRLTRDYARRRDVVVQGSSRRVQAWGLRNTLLWYKDHAYRPEHVDIR